MEDIKIGIVGGGFQGKGEAIWFAKRQFTVVIYDISREQLQSIEDEMKSSLKNQKLLKYLILTDNINDLSGCNLVIENVTENKDLKFKVLKDIESVVGRDAIISSNSSSYIPTHLAEALTHKDRFVNIHFLGVQFGIGLLELVPGIHTSQKAVEISRNILKSADFQVMEIKECPGFVFNRVIGAGLSNLFRAMEEYNLIDLSTFVRYLLYTIRGQWTTAHLDILGSEIAKALFEYLNASFGDRVYISNYLAERVKRNELGLKTGKGFFDYPNKRADAHLVERKIIKGVHSRIEKIFINAFHVNHINLVVALAKCNKKLYVDKIDTDSMQALSKIDPAIHKKVVSYLNEAGGPDDDGKYDMILDCRLAPFDVLIREVNRINERFGSEVPVALNTPIYRLEDIARDVSHPKEKLFLVNTQKSYLANSELVKNQSGNKNDYQDIKDLIIEIEGDCLEVNDGYGRPLMFMLISKYFEAARCLEEGIADIDQIYVLINQETVLKDMDYMGLDNLIYITEYLYEKYKGPFVVPEYVYSLVKDGRKGVMTGEGFYRY